MMWSITSQNGTAVRMHRQDEPRHVALEGAVPGLFVVGQGFDVGVDAVDLGAHGSTLTR